jgi:hypothetical protein
MALDVVLELIEVCHAETKAAMRLSQSVDCCLGLGLVRLGAGFFGQGYRPSAGDSQV